MAGIARFLFSNSKGLNTFKQRLRLEHHAFTPTERTVVHRLVAVLGKGPQVVHLDFNDPGFARPAHNAMFQRPAKEVRKNRNDLELHKTVASCWLLVAS